MKSLAVVIAHEHAGTLKQNFRGLLSFSYKDGYEGVPLSAAMPVSNRTYSDRKIRPYIMGLLPQAAKTRKKMAAAVQAGSSDTLALLEFYGLECAGAVQFCPPRDIATLVDADVPLGADGAGNGLEHMGKKKLARLVESGAKRDVLKLAKAGRWTLGGAPTRVAVYYGDGDVYLCAPGVASTHMLCVPGQESGLDTLSMFVCLETARRCGVPTVNCVWVDTAGAPALLVERFDRAELESGEVVRLHQESLCQALWALPDAKEEEDGGPDQFRMLEFLKRTGSCAQENVEHFLAMLLYSYLVGADDAHASSYSLLLALGDQVRIAPLHDIHSAFVTHALAEKTEVSTGLGSERRLGRVGKRKLARFVQQAQLEEWGIGEGVFLALAERLATLAPAAMGDVCAEFDMLPGMDALVGSMLAATEQHCERMLEKLGK